MDICERISNAKCCVVDIAEAYVKAFTFGDNTEAMLNELLLFNGYIDTILRHEKSLIYDNLSDEDKVCAENEIICLTDQEVCFILEQISLSCESCQCGC